MTSMTVEYYWTKCWINGLFYFAAMYFNGRPHIRSCFYNYIVKAKLTEVNLKKWNF